MSSKLHSLSQEAASAVASSSTPTRRRVTRRGRAYWEREAARAMRRAIRAHNTGQPAEIVEAFMHARSYALRRAEETI